MTNSPLVFVYLKNRYEAFSISEALKEKLQNDLSVYRFEFFDSFRKLSDRIEEADYLLTWLFPAELYQRDLSLKKIFTPAAGHDWVAHDPTGKVEVVHGEFHGEMIAEAFLGMMLYFNNDYHISAQHQKVGVWGASKLPTRRLLRNQRLLIVGYGKIGRHCAKISSALGCKVLGLKRSVIDPVDDLGIEVYSFDQMSELLPTVDHVLFLLPNHPDTNAFFKTEHFVLMKESAFIYNFGRGNCIEHEVLLEALKTKQIAGAGLDVFQTEPLPKNDEIFVLENVLVTPHSSCFCEEYLELFIDDLKL